MRGLLISLGLGALSVSVIEAAEIYKWVGPDGVTYYSETAPRTQPRGLERLELGDAVQPSRPAAGYESVLEVAKDIEASRLERERIRLEQERLRLEREKIAAQRERSSSGTERYVPVYPYLHYPRKYPRIPVHPRYGRKPFHDPYTGRGHRLHPGRGAVSARVPGMSKR